jgi:hypothetical protein
LVNSEIVMNPFKTNSCLASSMAKACIVGRQLLRFLLAALVFSVPGMAFAVTPILVQHVSGSNIRGNTPNSPYCYYQILPNPTTAGNAVVIGVTFDGSGTPTISDDQNDSYTIEENFFGSQYSQSVLLAAAPGVAAGARTVSVCFSSGHLYMAVMASEFSNVTGIDGSGVGAELSSTTSISAGSKTPSVQGDLVYQMTFLPGLPSGVEITAGSQNSIAWNLLSADLQDASSAQYGVYNSTAALNPTMILGSSKSAETAAIFLKVGNAGSVPTGMRIVHLEHEGFCGVATCGSAFTNPAKLQFPSSGNLIVALAGGGNPVCSMSGISDTSGNSWAQAGSTYTYPGGGYDTVQTYYAGNASASGSLGLTVQWTNSNCDWDILFYDITGAASSPLDTVSGGTGNQNSMIGGTLTVPYTLTPGNSGELVFTNNVIDYNTASGLISSVGTPYFDANIYSGEPISGPEPLDQNNGWGHAVSTSASAITFTWHFQNASLAVGPYASMAAAFKAGSSGAGLAPPTQLAATVQ